MTNRFGVRAGLMAAIASICLGVCASVAAADTISLTIDFAKIVKYDRPVKTLVLGNPGIADATVEDEKTVVLTGKAAGTTNLIVLDDKGQEITNSQIRVASDTRQLTTIFYGSTRKTYSCAPVCEKAIVVGDDQTTFSEAAQQIQQRQSLSNAQ